MNFLPIPLHRRGLLAGAFLFAATAATILWQNTHLAVLWDFAYVLDSSFRIALGQIPYRDFPFVHAPIPFLLQAALIRLCGRVYWHTALYAALAGGLGTLLTWRIIFHALPSKLSHAWAISLLLTAPLIPLGIYCILPHPSYDCDTALAFLLAFYLLQRTLQARPFAPRLPIAFLAGAALALTAFCKQNMGLPLLACALLALLFLLLIRPWRRSPLALPPRTLGSLFAGAAALLAAGLLALHLWAGLGNYFQWTVRFAGQRRMPALADMISVYLQPALLWMLPALALGLLLLRRAHAPLARTLATTLLAAPFLWTLSSTALTHDPDDRAATLLALWPLILILAAVLVLVRLFQRRFEQALLPLLLLAAIHGTFMSQQLWGSTYALWPLFVILLAELFTFAQPDPAAVQIAACPRLPLTLAAAISFTLLICGALYTVSEERLDYINLPFAPVDHSSFPSMRGASTPGPYLADFDELLRFAQNSIPFDDGIVLLPGEDPFFYATGRTPRFPVLLFDPSTDPFAPQDLARELRLRRIRWLIVKHELQIKTDVTPQRQPSMDLLTRDFHPVAQLHAYTVYRAW